MREEKEREEGNPFVHSGIYYCKTPPWKLVIKGEALTVDLDALVFLLPPVKEDSSYKNAL